VALFNADPSRFRAVLLDLTMPGMDGRETFAALRAIAPDVRVLLVSGFSEQEAQAEFQGDAPARFLQKPFELQRLRLAMRSVLGE
jgi:DNA-binding response OmpR family regulator